MVGNASVQLAEGLSVTVVTIVTVIACVIIMIGLMAFMKYSKAGHAMLAVSEDDGAAQLMGINVNATTRLPLRSVPDWQPSQVFCSAPLTRP